MITDDRMNNSIRMGFGTPRPAFWHDVGQVAINGTVCRNYRVLWVLMPHALPLATRNNCHPFTLNARHWDSWLGGSVTGSESSKWIVNSQGVCNRDRSGQIIACTGSGTGYTPVQTTRVWCSSNNLGENLLTTFQNYCLAFFFFIFGALIRK